MRKVRGHDYQLTKCVCIRQEILKAYPELEKEDITQALKYAARVSSEKPRSVPMKGASGA
jgi:hypothetical protein